MSKSSLIIALALQTISSALPTDYCKISCDYAEHTVCVNDPCTISSNCPLVNASVQPLNVTEREIVRDVHNYYRNKIALGHGLGYLRNVTAANMLIMSYDEELEFVAQCWANTCKYSHDICRRTSRFVSVGQTMGMLMDVEHPRAAENLEAIVKHWMYDSGHVHVKEVNSYSGDDYNQHQGFVQLIWAATYNVGCGRVVFKNGLYLLCNYAPAGNEQNFPIYKIGRPCSFCTKRCSSKYQGLCGHLRDINDDTFETHFNVGSNLMFYNFLMTFSLGVLMCSELYYSYY